MTVSVPSQLVYASQGDGSTTQFEYPVRFEEAGELVVISRVDGVDTVLTLNTDYTVAGAGVPAGGTVTMLYVPGTDEQIVRYRDTASKQIVDLEDRTKNPAEAVEDQLDRFAMIGQETREQLSRTVRVAPGNAPLKDFPPVQAGLPVLGNDDEDGLVFGEESYNGLRGRVDALEDENEEQDGRLTAAETKNSEQDGRLDAVESKNAEQDERLDNTERASASAARAEEAEADAEAARAGAVAAEIEATAQANRAESEASASQESANQAHNLVQQATAGFSGFEQGQAYDFGYVADVTTYFDQDWGSIADPVA